MKIQGSYEQNINLLDMAEKTTPRKKMSEVLPERKEGQGVSVDISEAGMEAWRKQTQEMSPKVEATEERVMTAADTNEVEYEHYSKMMDLTGDIYEKIRKEENREIDMNDIMKTMMDTYETLYNDILKAHENGDREVDYQITGKQSITLEQDLAGLDKAFNRRLSNLEGYITTQQTNKQFEGSARDTMEYIKRVKGLQASETTERKNDDFNYFETDYQNTVKSIMEQARDSFLQQIGSGTYKKGTGVNALLSIMQTNTSFIEGTQKLFS